MARKVNLALIVTHLAVCASFVILALAFAWPLPLTFDHAFLGSPGGDLGVYVWNLWIFRHQVVDHGTSPFFTSDILALGDQVALTLQNYTAGAGLLAFPLLPRLGTVATFNLLSLAGQVLSAYAMFALAYVSTRDRLASWLAGLVFGFSAFMSARQTEHLSLVLAAPLPLFVLALDRVTRGNWVSGAIAAGLLTAVAFLCDPYYAVYCGLILVCWLMSALVEVNVTRSNGNRHGPTRRVLDGAILGLAAVVVGISASGGWRFTALGANVSMRDAYTPVLLLTLLGGWRLLKGRRFRLAIRRPPRRLALILGLAALTLAAGLAPVLNAMSAGGGSPLGLSPPVHWRSSAPGLDLAAYVVSPMQHLAPSTVRAWTARQPNGFVENVAGLPWVAIGLIAFVARRLDRGLARRWFWFTGVALLLSLGPFLRVAGVDTHVPLPWAVLRYVPVLGAARMPTRFSVLVMMGIAMLLALAVSDLRKRTARPTILTGAVAFALVLELCPSPRPLYSAVVPSVYSEVRADRRDTRVLTLPFGMRDGLQSIGNASAADQFHQTYHGKPLIGGYISRLPAGESTRYLQRPVLKVLAELSEGRTPLVSEMDAAVADALGDTELKIGWVVVDLSRASPALVEFAVRAFDLELVGRDGNWRAYRPVRQTLNPMVY